jgi:hypothetical protein
VKEGSRQKQRENIWHCRQAERKYRIVIDRIKTEIELTEDAEIEKERKKDGEGR